MITRRTAMAAAALAAAPAFSHAQENGPVRLMVGLAAGGPNDIAARLLASKLKDTWGRPVLVENKVGAGQRVALGELRRSAPDGRTLLLVTNSPFTIYPHIYKKLEYDPFADFTPIARVLTFDMGVATGPMTNATSIRQFVEWAAANPQRAAYGSPGAGTLPHFLGVALGEAIKVPLTHVAYRGGNPAATDLVGGQVPLIITGLSDVVELHRAGKIRILAVTGDKRSPLVPEIPTLKESGVNVSSTISVSIFGPPRMARELVRKLSADFMAAANAPELRAAFGKYGLNVAPLGADEVTAAYHAEYDRLQSLVKASGYVPE